MGRPRRPYNGVEHILPNGDPWMRREYPGPGSLGTREQKRWEASTHWHYVAVNGLYDPLTYLYVLNAITGIDPNIELRANNLTAFLNTPKSEPAKAFVWDPITVGKILADLCEAFEDVIGEKQGLLERGKDYRGNFYRLHYNGEVAKVVYALRRDLIELAKEGIADRARGQRTERIESPLRECASVSEVWAKAAEAI